MTIQMQSMHVLYIKAAHSPLPCPADQTTGPAHVCHLQRKDGIGGGKENTDSLVVFFKIPTFRRVC